jgi:cell division GTPase FtsZ
MRIIAIGLGGAGCRIVDSLYSTDRKSSKVACIQGLAVDVDESSLQQLTALPESSRLYFAAMDPEISGHDRGTEPTVTIDIADIISHVNNFESGETDAIFVCLGLGGGMADIAPHVITGLRSTIVEPVFGLVTLPCLAEGEKRSAKAADDIDILSPLLDGMILFDNETWYKKTKALKAKLQKREKSLAHRLGLAKDEPELSPELATYQLLNEGIVRRISLILRAGEFKADGGIDLAEVVLDSGEVLNTMKGMGFITIGYAVDRLPSNPLAFLSQFRPQGVFDEENKKKASRIVDLAKQAIYHEISTPCDMTSAHKALILIAGPSHELSMKGFMTVRKWIDRSIAGLETRSGDYPVVNTTNVAIIIMLSGLENIPRIGELRDIRTQHQSWSKRGGAGAHLGIMKGPGAEGSGERGIIRDEMIVLPAAMKKEAGIPPRPDDVSNPRIREIPMTEAVRGREQHSEKAPSSIAEVRTTSSHHEKMQPVEAIPAIPSKHRLIITKERDSPLHKPAHSARPHAPLDARKTVSPTPIRRTGTIQETTLPSINLSAAGSKDAARQRIERELQKQRIKAMAGRAKPAEEVYAEEPPAPREPVRKRHEVRARIPTADSNPVNVTTDELPEQEQRTVIIPKRKLVSRPAEPRVPDAEGRDDATRYNEVQASQPITEDNYPSDEDNDQTVVIKDTAVRAKDRVFGGREVQKPKIALAKDEPLIHTSLKPKTPAGRSAHHQDDNESSQDHPVKTTDKKSKKPGDISWV